MKPQKPSTTKASKTSAQLEAHATSNVDAFLKSHALPFKAEIEALRSIILKSDSRITEGIKWNAPSFFCLDWFATFHLRSKDSVKIIFHRGAKVKAIGSSRYVDDPSAILEWITNDRCSATFTDLKDIRVKAAALTKIVSQWAENLVQETHR